MNHLNFQIESTNLQEISISKALFRLEAGEEECAAFW